MSHSCNPGDTEEQEINKSKGMPGTEKPMIVRDWSRVSEPSNSVKECYSAGSCLRKSFGHHA